VKGRRLARRVGAVCGLAVALTLLARSSARAGSDVFSNIAPASPLGSTAQFLRYPLDHYSLDQHFTVISASITGGVDVSGLIPEVAWFFATLVWLITSFLAKSVIELFAFSFNLDLVNGSSATGGAGALGPVSQAIHSIYANVFGAPWLVLAFSAVALWAMWRALVQRRYSETAGALALSLIYIVLAVFFVAEPGQTIGQASRWTDDMSRAFLSISSHGSPSAGEAATADDADQLWGLLVERPWAVLEFGGLEHCAIDGTGDEGSDPQSAPVRPLSKDAARNAALSGQLAEGTEVAAEGKTCINNANKYSSHFLRFGHDTDERNEEYEALNDGDAEKLPEADTEKAGYRLGVADKPATDAMEEGGQYQRLLLALIVAAGETGAFLLLGALSIGVILSQVLLLLLLAFSPVALVAAAIPGRGHDFFKAWLEKLGGYLLRKAAYSLVLAVLLAVNAAIADATSQLGWLFAFGLQAAFFWTVLIQRRTLTAGIVGIATGGRSPGKDLALDAVALYGGARLGLGALRGVGRAGGAVRRRRARRREEGRPSFGGTRTSTPVDWHDRSESAGGDGGGAGGDGGRDADDGPDRDRGPDPRTPDPGGGASDPDDESDGPKRQRGDRRREEPTSESPGGSSASDPTDPEGSAGDDADADTGDHRRRRRPETPNRPDPSGADQEGEEDAGEAGDASPASRRRAAGSGAGDEDDAEDSGRSSRRPGSKDRRRPAVRQDTDRAEAGGGPGEPGSARTPVKGSDLGDELREERERAARPPAGSRPVDGPPTPDEPPSSPPRRRRRRRRWRRRR
jgi:hypothetical protein